MLALNSYRLFVYTGICDMRKGFDGLSGVVRNEMAMDPLSGARFVFWACTERSRRAKPKNEEDGAQTNESSSVLDCYEVEQDTMFSARTTGDVHFDASAEVEQPQILRLRSE
jgi:hypothetical protein